MLYRFMPSRAQPKTSICLSNRIPTTPKQAKSGAPLEGLKVEDFIERDMFFRMGHAPVMVDILPEISGVDFDRAWQNRVQAVIDPQSGLMASFISSEDLIAAKRAAGRPQDLADVAALLKAAHVREAQTANRKQPPEPVDDNPIQ